MTWKQIYGDFSPKSETDLGGTKRRTKRTKRTKKRR
jgi:hypothetical protein